VVLLVLVHGGDDLGKGRVTEGGVQLVLVHGGVVCHFLASWGAFHLDGFVVSLNADVSYSVIHILDYGVLS
jgi:hypothetical protein